MPKQLQLEALSKGLRRLNK